MARLKYLEPADLEEKDRDLLARNVNIYKALAHSPGGTRHVSGLGRYIRNESRLDARLRELAILQVGYLTGCEYEYAHHIELGRGFGVSDDDIRALVAETAGEESALEPLAKAVLRAARELTEKLTLSDETYAALREGLDDDECLTDLIVVIGFYNCIVRVLAALEIDLEDGYDAFLEEFPLPGGAS
jgi:alkylhydroperoxidase family enzyme